MPAAATPDSTATRPSRRTLVRSAAWSLPVLSTVAAAPAFAASPCATATVNWASFTDGTTFTSTTVNGVTVSVAVSGATGATGNRTVKNNSGQLGAQNAYLQFVDLNNANGTSQTITFTFSAPVARLGFTILDVDSNSTTNGNWFDNVAVTTLGYTFTRASASVIGSGTVADPFRAASTNTNIAATASSANVGIQYSSVPLTSVTMTYTQTVAAGGTPRIGISNLTFQPVLC